MSAFTARAVAGALDLLRELHDDMLIIRTLILRSLRGKYRNNPLGVMLEILKPVVLCGAHYFYFAYAGRDVPNKVYLLFVLGGFGTWFCFIAAYSGTIEAAGKGGGATHIAGVTAMHVCLAKCVWAFLLFVAFTYLVAEGGHILGAPIDAPNLFLVCATFGLTAGLGFSFGLLTSAIGTVVPPLWPFLKLFRWALFITSGIYSSLSTVSRLEGQFISYNPLIHLTEWDRHAMDPGYPVFYAHLSYPASIMVVLLFVGLAAHRALTPRGRGMNGYYA